MNTARACVRLLLFVVAVLAIVGGCAAAGVLGAIARSALRSPRGRRDARLAVLQAKAAIQIASLRALCRALRIHVHPDAETLRLASERARRPTLFLSNHVGYLDVVVLGSLLPTCFLGKREVASWPLIGWAGRAAGMELVDRTTLGGRVAALLRIKRRLRSSSVLVFPEGSTTAAHEPSPGLWKAGQMWSARDAAGGVVCLGLCYVDQGAIAWIGDMELTPHLWAFLKRPESHVFVRARALAPAGEGAAPETTRARSRAAYETVRELCVAARGAVVEFQQPQVRGTRAAPFLAEEATCNPNS